MRLGSKQGLGQPSSFKDLLNMTKLKELCNSFLNNWKLERAEGRVLAGNRPCIPGVDFALVILDRYGDTFFAEDAPVLFDEILQTSLLIEGKVGEVKFLKFRAMHNRVKGFTKVGVDRIKVRSWVEALADQVSS